MKKTLLVALFAVFILAACNTKPKTETVTEDPELEALDSIEIVADSSDMVIDTVALDSEVISE